MITFQHTRIASDFFLGLHHLERGEWKRGFELWERRLEAFPTLCAFDRALPRWDGKATDKWVIIHHEYGIGDIIHFARYIPLVEQLCPRLILVVPTELERLFRVNFEVPVLDRIPRFAELQASVLSLPHLLGAYDLGGGPYLTVPAANGAFWGQTGFVTTGSLQDNNKNLTPAEADEIRAGRPWASMKPEATGAKDWLDTACILSALDKLVSVDTGVAHLGGALGVPVELWIRPKHDWRWHHNPYDSVKLRKLNVKASVA